MCRFLFLLLVCCFYSCRTTYQYHHAEVASLEMNNILAPLADSTDVAFIASYKAKVDAEMNEVIGTCDYAMDKGTPEGLLGNFATDACLLMCKETMKAVYPDFCFLNNGGLRAALPKGEITVGKIFELMPFENELVLVKASGKVVKQLCDFIANKGGMPVSGITMQIAETKAQEIRINNVPLDDGKQYVILTSDFLANGGDKITMFAECEKIPTHIKVRDAFLTYVRNISAQKKKINAQLEGRISIAK